MGLMITHIRQECINNKNLAQCFDILNLRELTTYVTSDRVLVTKAKADVVEAIIGELAEAIDRGDSMVRDAEAKSVLEELLAFISYNGEKEFFALGSPAALSSSPPRTNPSPPQKSSSPPHQKSPTKSASPPHQKISPPPNTSNPPPIAKTSLKIANKQNMYKNNIQPNKAAKKANPPPPIAIPNPLQYTILSHQPPLKPTQHHQVISPVTTTSPSRPQATTPPSSYPLPLATPPPSHSLPISPPPSSHILLTPQALSTPISPQPLSTPLSLPSPVRMVPPPTGQNPPSSEIFLGGRNVAVYSAS